MYRRLYTWAHGWSRRFNHSRSQFGGFKLSGVTRNKWRIFNSVI